MGTQGRRNEKSSLLNIWSMKFEKLTFRQRRLIKIEVEFDFKDQMNFRFPLSEEK